MLAWGRMEYRRQITGILKVKSITMIMQIVIFFKGNLAVCLCAASLRSLSLWEGAGQVHNTGPYGTAGGWVMFQGLYLF